MPTICASPIKAERMRITLLGPCGEPLVGEGSAQITADAFTEISNSPDYEEGQRFLQRKANGQPCVNERDAGFLNWIEQTVMVCTLDPAMIAAVTGEMLITDGDDTTGVVFGSGLLDTRFSVEVWQPVSGEGACAPGGEQRFIYWAFPHVFDAQIQDFTFENDVFTFGWQDTTKPASPLWDVGDPWLADTPVEVWGEGKHFAFNITTVPPPEVACGAVEVGS